jgi:hypothetical protein
LPVAPIVVILEAKVETVVGDFLVPEGARSSLFRRLAADLLEMPVQTLGQPRYRWFVIFRAALLASDVSSGHCHIV